MKKILMGLAAMGLSVSMLSSAIACGDVNHYYYGNYSASSISGLPKNSKINSISKINDNNDNTDNGVRFFVSANINNKGELFTNNLNNPDHPYSTVTQVVAKSLETASIRTTFTSKINQNYYLWVWTFDGQLWKSNALDKANYFFPKTFEEKFTGVVNLLTSGYFAVIQTKSENKYKDYILNEDSSSTSSAFVALDLKQSQYLNDQAWIYKFYFINSGDQNSAFAIAAETNDQSALYVINASLLFAKTNPKTEFIPKLNILATINSLSSYKNLLMISTPGGVSYFNLNFNTPLQSPLIQEVKALSEYNVFSFEEINKVFIAFTAQHGVFGAEYNSSNNTFSDEIDTYSGYNVDSHLNFVTKYTEPNPFLLAGTMNTGLFLYDAPESKSLTRTLRKNYNCVQAIPLTKSIFVVATGGNELLLIK